MHRNMKGQRRCNKRLQLNPYYVCLPRLLSTDNICEIRFNTPLLIYL
jgi:hypothetical protein